MSPGTRHAETIYSDLKQAILSGRYPPTTDLSIAILARELGTSPSPVRDALHRLYGERLLEQGDHHGFRVSAWTAAELRDCYTWHGRLVRIAMKGGGRSDPDRPTASEGWETDYSTPAAIVATAERMFLALAGRSRSGELCSAIGNTGERLRPIRLREIERWPDCIDELEAANTLATSGTENALLALLWNYHRRRIRAAPSLVVL